jgi:hypothetical protein
VHYGHEAKELVQPLIQLGNSFSRFRERRWQAEPYFRRASRIIVKHFGPEAVELLPVLDALVQFSTDQGLNSKAQVVLKQAQDIAARAYGTEQNKNRIQSLTLPRIFFTRGGSKFGAYPPPPNRQGPQCPTQHFQQHLVGMLYKP